LSIGSAIVTADVLPPSTARSDAAKTRAVVTIISDTQAKYSRTIDVLDALAVAKIDNVTFTVNEEE